MKQYYDIGTLLNQLFLRGIEYGFSPPKHVKAKRENVRTIGIALIE